MLWILKDRESTIQKKKKRKKMSKWKRGTRTEFSRCRRMPLGLLSYRRSLRQWHVTTSHRLKSGWPRSSLRRRKLQILRVIWWRLDLCGMWTIDRIVTLVHNSQMFVRLQVSRSVSRSAGSYSSADGDARTFHFG